MKNGFIFGVLVGVAAAVAITAMAMSNGKIGGQDEQKVSVPTQKQEDVVKEEEQKQPAAVSNQDKVEFIGEEGKSAVLKIKKSGGAVEVKEGTMSEPLFNPSKTQLALISPFGWEEMAELLVYDFETEKWKTAVAYDKQQQRGPKGVLWADDQRLLVIIGKTYGTVNVGGQVYVYDLQSGGLTQATDYPDKIQITSISKDESGMVTLQGILYTDAELNDHVPYEEKQPLSKFIQ
ncbi:MAG: DUF4652 domain-containing protein [Ectobacillus sp.]